MSTTLATLDEGERAEWRARLRARMRREQPPEPAPRYAPRREAAQAAQNDGRDEGKTGERQCRYCGRMRPLSEFTCQRWRSICAECRQEYDRERYRARLRRG